MASLRSRLFYRALQLFFGRLMPPAMSLEYYRRAANQPLFEPVPRGIYVKADTIGGVPGEWITPSGTLDEGVLLYLHGGGYVLRTPQVHRVMVARMARAANLRAFMTDYRLAPEHPFPAAVDDATAVYRALVNAGMPANRVVVAGESAGGGLTLALLLTLREHGDPMPAAAYILSAMLDCTFSGDTLPELQKHDPFLRLGDIQMQVSHYIGNHDSRNPLISPLFADLTGLPPLLIHVGEHEILRAEGEAFYQKAIAAGVDATLKTWAGQVHAFPIFAGFVPEGKQAIREMGMFFRQHLARAN